MTVEPPKDWKTDYDIFDPAYIKNPYPVWDDLREECPIAHSERWGGSWMPTKYADLFALAKDTKHFSSVNPLVVPIAPPEGFAEPNESEQFYGVSAPPITSDPPEHTWAKNLLLPPFSMKAVAKYEELTREHCRVLIDKFIANGRADGAVDYAQQIPPYVIARMLGVPTDMTDTFTQWVREFLEFGLTNFEMAANARVQILTFLWGQIQERKQNPLEGDLISHLIKSKVNGLPVPDTHILGSGFLLLVAGIDTTWSSIGSAVWHLAQNPEHRKRLISEPGLITSAVEELLRAYSPVTMARVITQNTDYGGCPMKQGERVLMNFPAANRDPEKFPDPDSVILDRPANPHIAFGVGIHRCAGSNLARMEMRVAIEELLAHIPDFSLEDPTVVTWAGGQVRGPRTLPIVFPSGGKP
ncbi:MAG TPA: cytochrome P450 [Dehalococcoidia bacterium]